MRLSRLRKNVGMAAKLHNMAADRRGQVVMVTLTYRTTEQWQPDHVKAYLQAVRKWFARLTGRARHLAYVWVAELQERGAMHYHVVFWLPKGVTMPKADKRGWWPHGMTNTLRAKKPVAYVMKYATKFDSKSGLPKGARIYGVGGLDDGARRVRRWLNWPAFVQARASVADAFARAPGGGWTDLSTGEWFPSEWKPAALWRLGARFLERVHDHGRPVADVAGPYNWIHERGGVAAPVFA